MFCTGERDQSAEDGELELLHSGDVGGAEHCLYDRSHGGCDTGVCDSGAVQQGSRLRV